MLVPKPCVNIFLKFAATCFRFNDFGICRRKVVRLFVPYLLVLCLLLTIDWLLEVKISFIKEVFKLLIVLNISAAKILILFMFTVEVLPFSKSVL